MKLVLHWVSIGFLTLGVVSSNNAYAGNWRFPIGVTYLKGIDEASDLWEQNRRNEGDNPDSSPAARISINFSPYYQFDNGLGLGLGIGPESGKLEKDDNGNLRIAFFNVPVHVDARWAYLPQGGGFSPYVRVGMRKNFAQGDYVVEGKIGPFAGIGFEYLRPRGVVDFGMELTVDKSEVEFDVVNASGNKTATRNIQLQKTMLSVYFIFGKTKR